MAMYMSLETLRTTFGGDLEHLLEEDLREALPEVLEQEYDPNGEGDVRGLVLEAEDADVALQRVAVEEPTTGDWNRGDAVLEEGGRLRRRGKTIHQSWACLLQTLRANDGSLLFCGDAVANMPPHRGMQHWIKSVWGNSAKVLRVHRVTTSSDEDDFVLNVRVRGLARTLEVSVRILARLLTWVMFRPRTLETLYGLRSRLRQEGRNLAYTDVSLALVGIDTVTLAFLVSERESSAWKELSGPLGQETVRLSSRFKSGLVSEGVFSKIGRGMASIVTEPLQMSGLYSPSVSLPTT
uniref:Uncharacterized protein n=1 Tax=Riboviria sp. TaxID=2585031 RepID=A0A514DCE3_9VIRU|nr:MAG: hypothetical protein H1Bulk303532_000002 [Riboviria sp.]